VKASEVKVIHGIRVGKPDVRQSAPAHLRGVPEGNQEGGWDRTHGFYDEGGVGKATAKRSTGIAPETEDPIDPRSPNLSPA
jgi:hypothetical protein